MSTSVAPAVRGRWGWYALDAAEFRKVKEFHRLLLRDRRATRRRQRWAAKLEKNRRGPEPACVGTDRETYRWVLEEYRRLRRPAAAAEDVTPADLPDDWDRRHAELAGFYGADPGPGPAHVPGP